jgi:hypothetical protein
MKIKIEVDCTPEEARAFFGLPDLGPVHDAMTEHMTERMAAAAKAMDPEAYLKYWMPGGAGLERMQEAFFSAMTGGAPSKNKDD